MVVGLIGGGDVFMDVQLQHRIYGTNFAAIVHRSCKTTVSYRTGCKTQDQLCSVFDNIAPLVDTQHLFSSRTGKYGRAYSWRSSSGMKSATYPDSLFQPLIRKFVGRASPSTRDTTRRWSSYSCQKYLSPLGSFATFANAMRYLIWRCGLLLDFIGTALAYQSTHQRS